MPEYRFYKITQTGHITEPSSVVVCPDDVAAIKEARKLLDGGDIEIWEGRRVVAYLVPESFAVERKK